MLVKINSLDTLFFRNAKPFDIGSSFPEGVFPPFPNTIYGAFRSAIIANSSGDKKDGFTRFKDGDLKEEIGILPHKDNGFKDDRGTFSIRDIMLSKGDEIYFPLPNDCIDDPIDKEKAINLLYQEKDRKVVFSQSKGFEYYPLKEKHKKLKNKWIDSIGLKKYLFFNKRFTIKEMDSFVTKENKTGIAIDKSKGSAKESMIYNIGMNRLKKDVSLVVKINGNNISWNKNFLKLGHDGKPAYFEIISEDQILENAKEEIKNSITTENPYFKLYFSTPILMSDFIQVIENKLENKIKIISVFYEKPIPVGGWDLAKSQPKPMYKAIPAGAVFYVKIEGVITEIFKNNLFNLFWNKNLQERDKNNFKFYHQEGFNHCYIGKLEKNKTEVKNV